VEFPTTMHSLESRNADAMVRRISMQRATSTGEVEARADDLAVEEPLDIRVNDHALALTMRTPGQDRELAAGFLLSEGIIRDRTAILDILPCREESSEADRVHVLLAKEAVFDPSRLSRHVFTSSSCGVCGKTAIETVCNQFESIASDGPEIDASVLFALPEKLAAVQRTFQKTGGLHAAALFTVEGEIAALREDVGRHNAMDKLCGWALLEGMLPLSTFGVLLSGRASFELMQKALAAGIPIVAAFSAPSSLAVEFAARSGQTLAAFLRNESLNLYTGAGRVRLARQTGSRP
jgi:FdhD protein